MSNCGTFYGCGQPVTDFGAPSGGYALLDQFNAAGLQKCKDEWDPYCVPRALTAEENNAVLQEIWRLSNSNEGFCQQMATVAIDMWYNNEILAYDEPDAPASLGQVQQSVYFAPGSSRDHAAGMKASAS